MDLSAVSQATAKAQNSFDIAKYSSLAVSAVSILVSLLILFLVVWPKLSETLQIKNSNSELTQKADSLKQKAGILSRLDQAELEEQVVASEQLLPSGKDTFLLISQIERAAASSGILLNRVESTPGLLDTASGGASGNPAAPSAGAQTAIAPSIKVSVSLTSGYSSLLSFLNNVLVIPRAVSITDLSVSSATSEGSSQLKASMSIIAYFKELPTDLGSIETPVAELSQSEKDRLEKIINTGLSATPSVTVPQVPLGRADIFAPF